MGLAHAHLSKAIGHGLAEDSLQGSRPLPQRKVALLVATLSSLTVAQEVKSVAGSIAK